VLRRRVGAATRAVVALAAVAVAGCGDDGVEGPAPAAPDQIRLSSPAFPPGGPIPQRFTCDGEDISPPLVWTGVPEATRTLALLVEDPDAPDGTFVHWTLFDMAAQTKALREDHVPADAREGENSFGDRGYGGPCPPEDDEPHRYRFLIYALRSKLGPGAGASAEDVRAAVAERAIARGRLTGRFGR
jgi:Raf kinase inhibitor-like YbhB/YbcL family protein